jgi:protein TonB
MPLSNEFPLPPLDEPPPPLPLATVSGGFLNDKALSKPAPVYPPVAIVSNVSGMVIVRVVVDERGRVTSANPISGNSLLQEAAVEAAYQARFAPTRLSGQPVRVSGMLSYNFVPQ